MNVKRSLENRIRGWLPKEPITSKPVQQSAQPFPANQERTSAYTNSMEQRTSFYIILPILLLVCFFAFGNLSYDYKIAWQTLVLGFILGLIAGAFIGLALTQKELESLSQKGKISSRILTLSTLSFIVAFIGMFFILFFYSGQELQARVLGIFFDVSLAGAVSFRFLNFIQCFRWENASKRRIYMGYFSVYTIPKTMSQSELK